MKGDRPDPDPTVLTDLLVTRATANLERLFDTKLGSLRAIEDERFRLTQERTAEQKADTRDAIKDALAAVKEANAKTEANTDRQLASLASQLSTSIDALRVAIDDLKGSAKQGGRDAYAGLVQIAGLILVLLTIGGIVFAVHR
jgi:hypothetical protein